MIVLWIALALLQEESTTLTLAFEKMHCDECKIELEATLKKTPGFKSVQTADGTATLVLEEKAALPAFGRLPKDLVLKSVGLSIRGTVVFSGDKASLIAKGTGATLALSNPDKSDPLGELKKKQGGKHRFRVAGVLAGGKSLVLESFQAADWKE